MLAGLGFGKVILFGEHFVVYGLSAIASAISLQSHVTIEKIKTNEHVFIDQQKTFPGVQNLTWNQAEKPITSVLQHLKIQDKLKIIMNGNLPLPHSGLGTSAANMVAFSRALNNYYNLKLTDKEINQAAYIGEKEIHGNPSGIDNTLSTFGGTLLFSKGKTENENETISIKLKKPIEIVLADSGKGSPTKDVIESVKKLKTKNPKLAASLFSKYKILIDKANQAFINFNLDQIGKLMNENHKLLQQLTVSSPELDEMVKIAREAGAFGAKLTGTGRGGLIVALTPGKELQDKVAVALEKKGFSTLTTTIG